MQPRAFEVVGIGAAPVPVLGLEPSLSRHSLPPRPKSAHSGRPAPALGAAIGRQRLAGPRQHDHAQGPAGQGRGAQLQRSLTFDALPNAASAGAAASGLLPAAVGMSHTQTITQINFTRCVLWNVRREAGHAF
jgi:hypothetical protein